jgi:NADH dehydrogenase FAD-containing subunit
MRQGPVLVDNLQAALEGRLGRRYHPPRHTLALLNCGDGTAILSYGPIAFRAGWAMVLKDWMDRRFVRRFR